MSYAKNKNMKLTLHLLFCIASGKKNCTLNLILSENQCLQTIVCLKLVPKHDKTKKKGTFTRRLNNAFLGMLTFFKHNFGSDCLTVL